MATGKVIDALTVTLGLDASDFHKGIGEVDKELGKTRGTVVKVSRDMGTAINGAARQFALAFLGFSTSAGLARMLVGLNETSRQLGLIGKNTGQTAQDLRNFGNAFAVAGGSLESFLSSVQAIQREQSNIQMSGQSGWFPFLRFLEVGITETGSDGIVRARDKLTVLKELADSFARLSQTKGRPFANSLGLQMGFDQESMNVLIQGGASIEAFVAQQKALSQNTDSLAESAARLRAQWVELKQKSENLAGVLLEKLGPQIESLLNWMNRTADSNGTTMIDGITRSIDDLVSSMKELLSWSEKLKGALPKWMTDAKLFEPPSMKGTSIERFDAAAGKIIKGLFEGEGMAAIPGTWQNNRAKYIGAIRAAEKKHGIPGELLEGIANKESHWRSDVISGQTRSSAGAVGLMQLMPQFFPGAGKDPNKDIETAAAYLAKLRKQFGNWEDAAAAYNAGPATLKAVKAGRGGLPTETADYVNSLFGAGAAQRVSAPVGTGTVLAPSASAPNTTTIGTINIYPALGTADSVRLEVASTIKRKGLVNQSDYGVRP